ncbi:MAG: serine hydrolase domain-containing protein [Chloroflexota bacterium]
MIRCIPEDVGLSSTRLQRINRKVNHYIEQGTLAGAVTLISRYGKVAHLETQGLQDIASQTPMAEDTLFRIYSMTKPITSVALMILFEEGRVALTDPVHKYLPELKDLKVYLRRENGVDQLEDARQEMTVRDLLRHTSGLSYGDFDYDEGGGPYGESDIFYRAEITNQQLVELMAELPLIHQPGTTWHYSGSTDVLGRLIEVVAGMTLGEFFDERILGPLGMTDSVFKVTEELRPRFASLYGPLGDEPLGLVGPSLREDFLDNILESGGGGLVCSINDYWRFCQMILNKGELDGVRILGRRTVEFMTCNHLTPSMIPIGLGGEMPGMGFGLGFSVVMDPGVAGTMASVGTHAWGGWASTRFWIDPVEELIAILMIQYIGDESHPLRNDFQDLVYQAIMD